MKHIKCVLSFLIVLSFLAILILPSFLNMCIPDGCTFRPNVCSDGACFNETIGQHLNEKSQLFTAIVKLQIFFIVAVLIAFAFVIKKDIESNERFFVKFYTWQSLLNPLKSNNYLIEAISNGIVNPKIF
ncbi:MAG: hypothetical protein M1308_13990 [Actinobacteria bacterium]|nr:hypothetical protein [Actinomycetota bacterium]